MSGIAFVDTETTGLDPARHQVYEVAAIVDGAEYTWWLPVDVAQADPVGLSIGRYHERHPYGNAFPRKAGVRAPRVDSVATFAGVFARLTHGRHLAGAVVSFDEERLRRLLLGAGIAPSWHYHLVDVEALAAGRLSAEPPWNSEDLSRSLQVTPDEFDRHTALGDARWAKAIYEAVMGR